MTHAEKIRKFIKECPIDSCLGGKDCYTCNLARGLLTGLSALDCMCSNPECNPDNPHIEAIATAMGLNK